jgi:ubiquinone/menaquinone biosynthesis C-methylase UbiE
LNHQLRNLLKKIPFVQRMVRIARGAPPVDRRVADPRYNAITLYADGVAIPPIEMRDRVRKSAILAEDFLLEGRQAYEAIRAMLDRNGIILGSDSKVYDFGCGCGRIARHFFGVELGAFFGSDVDEKLIGWNIENLKSESVREVSFFTNGYLPPTPMPEGSVDFLYSISVITHMNAEAQTAWLAEMARVVRPGGHVLISFVERPPEKMKDGILVVERVDREFQREWLGRNKAPSVYYNTYNTADYLAEQLSFGCDRVDVERKAVRGHQDLILLRKRKRRLSH